MLFQSSCLYQENNLTSVQLMLEEIDVVIKFLSIFFTATTRKDDDSNLILWKTKICDIDVMTELIFLDPQVGQQIENKF